VDRRCPNPFDLGETFGSTMICGIGISGRISNQTEAYWESKCKFWGDKFYTPWLKTMVLISVGGDVGWIRKNDLRG